jgi:hypothetical protein
MDAEFRGIDISITTEEEPQQQIGFEQEASNEAFYGATHGEDFAGRAADVTGAKGESAPVTGQRVPSEKMKAHPLRIPDGKTRISISRRSVA